MKKILFLLLAVSPVVLPAEEMKFVTTLSQPVGSFARVEAVNANRPAQALQVNFCNNKVSSGNISVNGAVRAAYLKLDNTGSLGGNVPVYQLKTLNLGSGKDFQGGNVWANEANPAKIKADGTLYGKDMSYLVAELPALKITNTANIKSGGPTGEDLEWGAQFTCDYRQTVGESSGEVDKITVSDWRVGEYRDETCNDNAYDALNTDSSDFLKDVTASSSCTDCRVVDFNSTTLYPYTLGDEPPWGTDHWWSTYKAWSPGGGYSYSHGNVDFGDWVMKMLKEDKGNGDLSDYSTTRAYCDSTTYVPQKYRTGYNLFLGHQENMYLGSDMSYICFYAMAKVECRNISWTFKAKEGTVECISGGKNYDSYILKSK